MKEPETGLQHPDPRAAPEYVPLIAVPERVAEPVADPEHGEPNVSVKVAVCPLMVPETVPPPGPGMSALKLQPDCATTTVPDPETPHEL